MHCVSKQWGCVSLEHADVTNALQLLHHFFHHSTHANLIICVHGIVHLSTACCMSYLYYYTLHWWGQTTSRKALQLRETVHMTVLTPAGLSLNLYWIWIVAHHSPCCLEDQGAKCHLEPLEWSMNLMKMQGGSPFANLHLHLLKVSLCVMKYNYIACFNGLSLAAVR